MKSVTINQFVKHIKKEMPKRSQLTPDVIVAIKLKLREHNNTAILRGSEYIFCEFLLIFNPCSDVQIKKFLLGRRVSLGYIYDQI